MSNPNGPVVQTPGTCGGKPRIRGRRITTAWLAREFYAGLAVATLAYIHKLQESQVEAAIRFEDKRAKQ